MQKRDSEAFPNEVEALRTARTAATDPTLGIEDVQKAFINLCDEYEKLLEETRFLTKTADKLEMKLNAANEKLKAEKNVLATEAEINRTEKEKALHKNKQLFQEKAEAVTSINKLQTTLIIIVVLLIVLVIVLGYYATHPQKMIEILNALGFKQKDLCSIHLKSLVAPELIQNS
jgi:cell division protein FtsL